MATWPAAADDADRASAHERDEDFDRDPPAPTPPAMTYESLFRAVRAELGEYHSFSISVETWHHGHFSFEAKVDTRWSVYVSGGQFYYGKTPDEAYRAFMESRQAEPPLVETSALVNPEAIASDGE